MKKKKIQIALLLLIVMIATSCQSTPEREIVVGKNNELIEEALSNDNENIIITQPVFPEHWHDSYEKYDGKFKIEIDAVISTMKLEEYPVCSIKPFAIPIEQANLIVSEIFGSLDVYNVEVEMSKEELGLQIIDIKYQIANLDGEDSDKLTELNNVLEYLYTAYEKAPEEATPTKYSGDFETLESSYLNRNQNSAYLILLREDPFDYTKPYLRISKSKLFGVSEDYTTDILYEKPNVEYYSYLDSDIFKLKFYEHPIYKTQEAQEAIMVAEQFLENIGVENKVVDDVYANTTSESSNEIVSYTVVFANQFNDVTIPYNIQIGTIIRNENNEYNAYYPAETLKVGVKDNAIEYFEWNYMYEANETIASNVQLLPFEEIMANAEQQLIAKYAYIDANDERLDIFIDEIILTYAIAPIKDAPYEYMIVPAWGFFGGTKLERGFQLPNGEVVKKSRSAISWLAVNAIDGTILSN